MNILTLLILNIAFFICNIYPKHIVEVSGPLPVLAIVLNLVFYLVFALFLLVSINKSKTLFSEGIIASFKKDDRKGMLVRILLIFATQMSLDILGWFSSSYFQENALYVRNILTIIAWIAFYCICTTKEGNIFRKQKSFLVIIALAILMAWNVYDTARLLEDLSSTFEKYQPLSKDVLQTINNTEYLFALKNCMLDTLCGSVLLSAHFILNKATTVKKRPNIMVFGIRALALIILVWPMVAAKYWIYPHSCLYETSRPISEHNYYEPSGIPFDQTKTETISISRIDENSEKLVYEKMNHKVYYQGSVCFEYSSAFGTLSLDKKTVGDVTYYLYNRQAFGLFIDGEPVFLCADEAPSFANDTLTAIYKNLIEKLEWNFFEQGAKYLLEHDREFIEPYLARYSSGEFEEEELKALDEMSINATYIQGIATSLKDN